MTNTNLHTLKRSQRMLTVRDVWYDDTTLYTDADVVYYMNMDKPIGNDYYDQFTILKDLTLTEEELFSRINATGRNEIRSVQHSGQYNYIMHYADLDQSLLNNFIEAYNSFAVAKKLRKADTHRLQAYFNNGMLAISQVVDAGKNVIAWHAYRVNTERVFLISSISVLPQQTDTKTKQDIGAANRYGHWMDTLYFKQQGIAVYDWGGWYNGHEDKALLGVNAFKEKFGGSITPNYNSIVYVTFKGKLFRLVKKLLSRG